MQNKKLRKALAVSMAIAMTGGLLAGCGSNNSSSSNGGAAKSGSTSSASGELDTSEFVELSMYVISDRPAGQDAIDENLNKLLKEKLNCSLKINWIGWAEYANKYPLLFSSGEEFDMAYSASWLNFAYNFCRRQNKRIKSRYWSRTYRGGMRAVPAFSENSHHVWEGTKL